MFRFRLETGVGELVRSLLGVFAERQNGIGALGGGEFGGEDALDGGREGGGVMALGSGTLG